MLTKSVIESLNAFQKQNISLIINELNKRGMTNLILHAGILAVCYKETKLKPQNENMMYSAERILKVFPSRIKTLAEAKLYANNPVALANKVYGKRFGNGQNEGYLCRGRGFNQLTFKDGYKAAGKAIGVDLLPNPEIANTPIIAAKLLASYYNGNARIIFKKVNINLVTNLKQAAEIAYDITAGEAGKHKHDVTGGFATVNAVINDFYDYLKTSYPSNTRDRRGG